MKQSLLVVLNRVKQTRKRFARDHTVNRKIKFGERFNFLERLDFILSLQRISKKILLNVGRSNSYLRSSITRRTIQ